MKNYALKGKEKRLLTHVLLSHTLSALARREGNLPAPGRESKFPQKAAAALAGEGRTSFGLRGTC